MFSAVFISISVISRRSVHLSMLPWSSFNQYSAQYFFPSHWLFSHITTVERMDSGEIGMNPFAMAIINPRKEYWPSRGSNQRSNPRPPVLNATDHYRLSYGARQVRNKETNEHKYRSRAGFEPRTLGRDANTIARELKRISLKQL